MTKALRVTIKAPSRLILSLIISMLCCVSAVVQAQEEPDWWFDVEILIFKHNNAHNTVTEQFDTVVDKPFSSRLDNVFLPFFVTDISWLQQALPDCPELAISLDCTYPVSLSDLVKRNQPVDHYQDYPTLPVTYPGVIFPRSEYAHILPQSELQLTSLYKDINWDKSYTPLLHTVWRQPVNINEENAFSIPILAGQNLTYQDKATRKLIKESQQLALAETTTSTDMPSTDTDDAKGTQNKQLLESTSKHILPQIRHALTSANILYPDQLKTTQNKGMIDTTSVFEFEGLLTIYIKYINRVPYLHIDSHALFNVAELTPQQPVDTPLTPTLSANKPVSIIPHTFKQRRRIISNQVHYFDHPYFGMVVELRRYKRPAVIEQD